MLKFNSLKFKISLTAFLIISVIMTVATLRHLNHTEQKLLNAQKEKAELLAMRIKQGIMVLMLKNSWQDLQIMMESLVKDSKELKKIRIFLPEDGNIVSSSDPEEVGRQIYTEDLKRYRNQNVQYTLLLDREGRRYASKLTAIENQPACHKCHGPEKKILGVLDIEMSISAVTRSIRAFKEEHLVDAVIGFFLIVGSVLIIVGILFDRPIKKMIRTIRKIENGDLSARMETGKRDELGLLAGSFNNMVEALESAKKDLELSHKHQIEKAAKLASLGEIISGIAHEIKNPLAGISCAIQVLQSELDKSDSTRTVSTEILNQLKSLDKVVKDLLRYAKPKPPEFLPCKIQDVLQKASFFVYPEAKKHKVVIKTEIEKDIPEIMIDPDQIQQVFLNLMINAVQAMSKGGTLTVSIFQKRLQRIENKIKEPIKSDRAVVIRFQDTGKGISSDDISNIFEPFFTDKSKGTGLGLPISRKIARDHGGDITCNSELGRGSLFTVYLPIVNGKQ